MNHFFFRYRTVETESGTRVNSKLRFFMKYGGFGIFLQFLTYFLTITLTISTEKFVFMKNYQQPVTNVKKIGAKFKVGIS